MHKVLKVKDIMTVGMITISPNADISEAVKLMNRENVRRLPVLDNKKLVGLLTVSDILNSQPQLYKKLHECMFQKRK